MPSRPCLARNSSFITSTPCPPIGGLDTLWIVLAEAKDTGGRFSMMEELARKDSGPGPRPEDRRRHVAADRLGALRTADINKDLGRCIMLLTELAAFSQNHDRSDRADLVQRDKKTRPCAEVARKSCISRARFSLFRVSRVHYLSARTKGNSLQPGGRGVGGSAGRPDRRLSSPRIQARSSRMFSRRDFE